MGEIKRCLPPGVKGGNTQRREDLKGGDVAPRVLAWGCIKFTVTRKGRRVNEFRRFLHILHGHPL